MKNKGFTLAELLGVIVIISIILSLGSNILSIILFNKKEI